MFNILETSLVTKRHLYTHTDTDLSDNVIGKEKFDSFDSLLPSAV